MKLEIDVSEEDLEKITRGRLVEKLRMLDWALKHSAEGHPKALRDVREALLIVIDWMGE